MKKTAIAALAVLCAFCDTTGPDDDFDQSLFSLRFVNRGTYTITAFHLRRADSDSTAWGANMLPIDSLRTHEYVWFPGLTTGPVYSFRVYFDSNGTAVSLTHDSMWTSPDTITAHAGLGDGSWSIGYGWGLDSLEGETDVTP